MSYAQSLGNDGKKNAPVSRGVFAFGKYLPKNSSAYAAAFSAEPSTTCGALRPRDRNAAGLLGLGDLADEIDVEQAVLERGVLHLHEIGKLEGALEGARGDAAVEHFGLVLAVLVGGFLALDRQRVFLRDDGKLVLGEAGDRNA